MGERMTPDEARRVHLPLNPIARHFTVKRMVHDPDIVGDDVNVAIGIREMNRMGSSDGETKLPEGNFIGIAQNNPFIGRGILVTVIEMANEFKE